MLSVINYVRLLLHTVRSNELHFSETVDGQECNTLHQACNVRDLLEDDMHWTQTLGEAAKLCGSPPRLRDLLAMILYLCAPSDPNELWD